MMQRRKAAEDVFVGTQPDESGLRELAQERVASIINLHDEQAEQPIPPGDEGVHVQELGMDYLSLPVSCDSLTRHHVDDFRTKLQLMAKPVFIHSPGAQLAAAFVSMDLAATHHWTGAETLERAEQLGVDGTSQELREFVRSYADNRHDGGSG